jgi:hypothetical protein
MVTGRSMEQARAAGELSGPGDEAAARDARVRSSPTFQTVWPPESRALAPLRRLAREGGAQVRRGALVLAGAARPAWLALTRDGRLLAAVLICEDAVGGGR